MKTKNFQKNLRPENKINWLLGIIAGDGDVSDRYVRVYNNDRLIIRNCEEIFQEGFGINRTKFKIRLLAKNRKGYKRNVETVELGINSTTFANCFKNLIRDQLDNPTTGFMRGLFDAEGSVDLAGNIVLWQRKDKKGTLVSKAIKRFLEDGKIKFRLIKNQDFYIFEILGRYKYYQNLVKFSETIGFVSPRKIKDLSLILETFSRKTFISGQQFLNFISDNQKVTLRQVIENFKVPKSNAYSALNKLVVDKKLIKIKSYPNIYKLC